MSIKSLSLAALALSVLGTAIPANAQAQELRPIMVENLCRKPIRLWINHADGYRNWHSHGSYFITAYQGSTYLEDRGVRLKQLTDHGLYFYAESTDGNTVWDGQFNTPVNGFDLPMRKANYSYRYATYHIQLTCQ
jgi:hypothetical protein